MTELALTVGILAEVQNGESRVAVVPEDAAKLVSRGMKIIIQSGAGVASLFSDDDYIRAGAAIATDRSEVLFNSEIVLMLQRPSYDDLRMMKQGTVVAGSIYPVRFPELVQRLAEEGVTAFSLELMPRTTRAQSMDILSSQSSVAGYRAAVTGAFHSKRFMPMLTTAAGTVRPASVLVIGAGVAGLMAIATCRRLGASVTAYDVRKPAGEDVRSLGAKFLDTGIDATGTGGYARELTEDERQKEKMVLEEALLASDIVITTAGVPGKKAPMIISGDTVSRMKRGAIIVDITAESGGNCELTEPGRITDTGRVKIIGLENAPSEVPVNASQMYSRNMREFLSILVDEAGNIVRPESDDLLTACLVCTGGRITYDRLNGGGAKS